MLGLVVRQGMTLAAIGVGATDVLLRAFRLAHAAACFALPIFAPSSRFAAK